MYGSRCVNGEPPDEYDLMETIEAWIIERYDLTEYDRWSEWVENEDKQFESSEHDKVPSYITRLLPWLFYEFIGHEENNYDLELSYFEDIFLILVIFSFFSNDEKYLPVNQDYQYIYLQMTTRICEWLTTEETILQRFGQKKKLEEYTTLSGVKSHRISFDYGGYIESIWAHAKEVLENMMRELSGQFEPIDFEELDKSLPEDRTQLMKSITAWFNTIEITDEDITSLIRQKCPESVYSLGFERYSKIDPRYRLMIYSSLIRQIYAHNSQTCLIFNANTNNRLRELIELGHQCLDDRNKKFLDFEEWFSEDDIIYNFQMLSQTSSVFLRPNTVEVFHHCSLMERMQSHWDVWTSIDGCFKRSLTTKLLVAMSSLNSDTQIKFQSMVDSISSESNNEHAGHNYLGENENYNFRDLQVNALILKNDIERIIDEIKEDTGKSAIKRVKDFKNSKKRHLSLYNQLGIETYIKSENRRGRRIEILYYHQNKDKPNLEFEIEHLPKSLDKISELFDETHCIISAPYLILVMLAHVLRFTQCINSLGNFSNKQIIAEFEESIGDCLSVISKWGYQIWPLSVIRNLFRNDDATEPLESIGLGKVIEIQNELKDLFEQNISDSLCFPDLIPSELSPHFG